jgi:formate dehydrogenase major subunit
MGVRAFIERYPVCVKDGKVIWMEGDPDSPVSCGCLCPKGSASFELTAGSARQYRVKHRRLFGAVQVRI